ncbi:hypothetical protein KSX_82540 [Ktedonospora formicarum]|uniref:Uncharacterized protein n=1 Tax=Ktedonospora formicarum TaxID=2778364 RepID=A0A8J3I7L3_9CHLR|nr:hypothetical protein KSX_82540 [Ktedonospora formicarum]
MANEQTLPSPGKSPSLQVADKALGALPRYDWHEPEQMSSLIIAATPMPQPIPKAASRS